MALFRKKLSTYSGKGTLTSKDSAITAPIQFTCSQLFDGTIEGEIQIAAGAREAFPFSRVLGVEFTINGETDDGEKLFAEEVMMTSVNWGTREGQTIGELKFSAILLDLERRKLKSVDSTVMLNYGITCLELFRVWSDTKVGKIVFAKLKECETALEDIKTHGRACLTSMAQLKVKPEIKHEEARDYINSTKNELWKVLDLTSLAQGIYQDWMNCQVCEKVGDNYEIVHIQHRKPRTRLMKPRGLIHMLDLREYLAKTYPNYTDDLDSRTGFRGGLEWYIEALSAGVLEAKYLMGFVCLELLVDRFNKRTGRDKILEDDTFSGFEERVQGEARRILREMNVDSSKRAGIYSGLGGLNRYPFASDLAELLKENRIGHSDLFEDLGKIAEIRNKIAHEGMAALPIETLHQYYLKIITLIQRILLSLIWYDGDIFNWTHNFKVEQFNRDPRNEYPSK